MEILTSKPTKFAEQIVKQHGIEIFFSKIDGAGDTDKKSLKSNKLGFSTLSNQDISIMIGDRVEDIVAGRVNNVDTVAVTYGFDDLELLKKQKPTYCIDSIIDLVDIIKIN
jgi:phosphoglycolate phosphatase